MVRRHEGRFVEVRRVATPFEAELIVGRLVSEGVAARSDGSTVLQDEWGSIQRVLGGGLIRVYVPEADLARAEEILASPSADEAGGEGGSEGGEGDDRGDPDPT